MNKLSRYDSIDLGDKSVMTKPATPQDTQFNVACRGCLSCASTTDPLDAALFVADHVRDFGHFVEVTDPTVLGHVDRIMAQRYCKLVESYHAN